jgi:membrane protein DedA with SNARE-associated domain/membrane-associated phospholipid phosphatase
MVHDYLQPLLAWLHIHPYWGGIITFLVASIESLAVIGTIIPGSVTLTAIGVLVGSGVLPMVETLLWAIAGAAVGDGVSYWFGYHYHERLRQMWPFTRYPNLITRGEAFFARHGGKSIVIGRFTGPVRSIVPLVAGMLNMDSRKFFFSNILSAFAWAPAYMGPGILIGAASIELSPEIATKIVLSLLVGLLLIVLFIWLLRRSMSWMIKSLDHKLTQLWHFCARQPNLRAVHSLLRDPAHPHAHGQLTTAILWFLILTSLSVLTLEVIYQGALTDWNAPITNLLTSIRTKSLDRFMVLVSLSAQPAVLLTVYFGICFYLLLGRYWRALFHWLANGIIVGTATVLMHHWISSPRPQLVTVVPTINSFPSGHMVLATSVIGLILLTLASLSPPQKRSYYYYAAAGYIFLIGTSRIYLGVHWLTDALGGFCLSIASITLVTLSFRRKRYRLPPKSGILLTSSLLWFSSWLVIIAVALPVAMHNYRLQEKVEKILYAQWWQQTTPLLPTARQDRLGNDSVNFTIQAALDLNQIRTQLQQHGWQEAPQQNWVRTLSVLVSPHKEQALPLFSPIYRHQAPSLIMTKITGDDAPLLIAEFWPSGFEFTDAKQKLFIGSVNYRGVWQHSWSIRQPLTPTFRPDPLQLISADLGVYQQRTLHYPSSLPESTHFDLLLVKPKLN